MPLPKCTGIFPVGCVDIMTKTSIVPKIFDPEFICGNDLGSFIRLYFPCDQSCAVSASKKASWIPEPNQKLYSYAFANYVNMGNTLGWLAHMWSRSITMEAISNATIIDQSSWKKLQHIQSLKENEKLPLIVFSHGLGGQRALYSVFCTQLASEGFIVAAIEHRDMSSTATYVMDENGDAVEIPFFPDTTKTDEDKKELMKLRNIQLEKRTNEVSVTLDILEELDLAPEHIDNCIGIDYNMIMFKGRIDTSNPLMMGHSFGGATMLNSLKKEPRLKYGVGLDVWFEPFTEEFFSPNEESNKPIFLIFTEYFNFKYNMKRCYKFMANYAKDYVEVVTLKKARHYDQCDIPGVIPSWLTSWFLKKRQDVKPYADAISSQRKLITDYIWKYFQKKGVSGSVELLGDDYDLADDFMVGSSIKVEDE